MGEKGNDAVASGPAVQQGGGATAGGATAGGATNGGPTSQDPGTGTGTNPAPVSGGGGGQQADQTKERELASATATDPTGLRTEVWEYAEGGSGGRYEWRDPETGYVGDSGIWREYEDYAESNFTNPDGTETTVRRSADGSIDRYTRDADGNQVSNEHLDPSGQMESRGFRNPDGGWTSEYRNDDGSINRQVTDADGNISDDTPRG